MKKAILLFLAFIVSGCSSINPMNTSNDNLSLQEVVENTIKIRNKGIVVNSDEISLDTEKYTYLILNNNFKTCIQLNKNKNTIGLGKTVNDNCKKAFLEYGRKK
jgi:uncharacterized protein YcfL